MNAIASHNPAATLLRQHLMTNQGALMEETSPTVVNIHDSDIGERRKAVLSEANARVAIDDDLWKRVAKPVLVLRGPAQARYLDLHVGDTRYGTPIIAGPYGGTPLESPARTMLFPVEELEQVVAFASEHELVPNWEIPDYRVENPDLTSFDRWSDIVARTAEFVVHRHSDLIGGMNSEAIARWLEIRDRATEYRRSGNAATLVGLMEDAIPGLLSTTGPLAGDEVWTQAHECLQIFERFSPNVAPAMTAGSTLGPGR